MSTDTQELRESFVRTFGLQPTRTSVAPGRVNLIGEHTDYNEGFVLPMAIDRTVAVASRPNDTTRIRAFSLNFDERDQFDLDHIVKAESPGWSDYLRGVAWALQEAGHSLVGLDIAISGDVPRGAGLSSSAALEVAVAGALSAAAGIKIDKRQIALIAQRAENEFVGVACGIMDQLTATSGREGHALLIDCRSLEVEAVPLPAGVDIVVVESGVERRLSETRYNLRRQECSAAARALGLPSLRELDEETLDLRRDTLPDVQIRRARHVAGENRRVIDSIEALRSCDVQRFGTLMYESHASLRDDFEVSCPELDLLVGLGRRTEGVLGARLTGAGFGGCTVNLVQSRAVESFSANVLETYRLDSGIEARTHVCRAADGLRVSDA